MIEWIKCSDRLPTQEDFRSDIIIGFGGGSVKLCTKITDDITHWMPWPEPPYPELFPCPVCDGNAKGYPDKMEFGCPICGVFACSSVAWNAIPRWREKK